MTINELIKKYPSRQVLSNTYDLPAHFSEELHQHPWHQILFPISGLLQSEIAGKNVIVPHNGLIFIPANTLHKSVSVTRTQFLAVFLNPKGAVDYGHSFKSCLVSAFLKELIVLLIDQGLDNQAEQMTTNMLSVLRDQITIAERYEIPLLIPKDRRLLAIFKELNQQPDLPLTLAEWAVKVGASQRTLSRLCAKEFNQSFSMWRQNIRLVLSLQCLESKQSIQDIALELGYQSDSAYIHAFKGLFNQTPSQYRKRYLLG
ncbi:helix-turn-helix transcriptional regulator [Marinomonas transparens]|uniref:Helix-turn-helix domain-containing protein n=1 Tax=Marinomonas transparens TaxID=2795388 RepID=A0A934N111_9GAMM|nr:AraC family transcriptional regulator [Marinomonas transparens]MBJ7539080.1 helix-turn-helix domain-containing protein [Marinomonas transparens]